MKTLNDYMAMSWMEILRIRMRVVLWFLTLICRDVLPVVKQ